MAKGKIENAIKLAAYPKQPDSLLFSYLSFLPAPYNDPANQVYYQIPYPDPSGIFGNYVDFFYSLNSSSTEFVSLTMAFSQIEAFSNLSASVTSNSNFADIRIGAANFNAADAGAYASPGARKQAQEMV